MGRLPDGWIEVAPEFRNPAGTVESMTIKTYIAVLHDGSTTSDGGQPVACPFQPNGTPKPVIDHHGLMYRLIDGQAPSGIYDYRLDEAD